MTETMFGCAGVLETQPIGMGGQDRQSLPGWQMVSKPNYNSLCRRHEILFKQSISETEKVPIIGIG